MFKKRTKERLEEGQGLVEYALILVLVSVVVIVIVAVLGEQIVNLFCKITLQLDPTIDVPICQKLDVNCAGIAEGATVSGNITLEATVTDSAPPDNVKNVVFSLDGAPRHTESIPRYCFGGGDGSCDRFNTRTLSNGSHTISAVATDEDGNTGSCTVTFTVAN